MTGLEHFPAARYRFDLTAQTTLELPVYAGSALRGAFGHALKRTVCITRQPECKTCALYRSCPGPAIFSPPPPPQHDLQRFSEIPPPYVIEPPLWGRRRYEPGDRIYFHMVLVGSALKFLPLIVEVWRTAFNRGVGTGDGQAYLDAVFLENELGQISKIDLQSAGLQESARLPPSPPFSSNRVSLQFITPLRLQKNGRPLSVDELTPDRLLLGLVRRTALLLTLHASHEIDFDFRSFSLAAKQVTGEKNLQWRDWGRYSSRQKQDMKLGGAIGRWILSGELESFWPLLHWGHWLHVGKETSFGLGRYAIEPLC